MQRLVRYSLLIVVLTGIVLFLPSLSNGFLADDVYHLAVLERFERLDDVGPLSIYTFEEGKPDRMGPVQGSLGPWWASENYRQNFFRPVSSFFHLVDHSLFGLEPVGYHATNLLLWGLLLAMVVWFYRELARDFGQSSLTVLLAGLLFALDDAHVLNVAWLAHRYALVGAIFTLGAFLQYHRFRRDGKTRSLLWSLLLCTLGLLSDEGTIGIVFWVAAYEICLRRDQLGKRAISAAPVMVLVLVYLTIYNLLGYGCAGSENYLDPLRNPARFVQEGFLERFPFLITGALTPVPAQLSFTRVVTGEAWPLLVAWGLGIVVVLLFVPLLRRNPLVRFMALCALLSMLPRAAAFAHNRLLLLPTIGTAWMLAAYVTGARRDQPASFLVLWSRRIVVVLILGFHGLVAPTQALFDTNGYRKQAKKELAAALEAEMPGPEQSDDARVLLLAGPASGVYMAGLRWIAGLPYPEAVWMVAAGKGAYRFTRTGPASFSIKLLSGDFLGGIGARNCVEEFSFSRGQRFRQGAMQVVINDVEGGRIREIEVTIDRPLDQPEVWLVVWDGKRFIRRRVPPWTPPRRR
ncbi:hypothetical protein ACFL2F_03935 [Myxococcota bacterium]